MERKTINTARNLGSPAPNKAAGEPAAMPGHIAMLSAAIIWGVMIPLVKDVLLTGKISGLALSATRVAGAATIFWLASWILPRRITCDRPLDRRDLPRLFVASIFIVSLNQALFIVGIGLTTPIESAVMATMTPVFTLIFAAIFISMPMTLMKVGGVVMGLAGAIWLSISAAASATTAAPAPLVGDIMCLIAQISAAIYFVGFRSLIARYGAFTMMKWLFLISSITYVPFVTPQLLDGAWAELSVANWLSIAYIVFFGSFISYILMPIAQMHLKPTTVAMYNYVQPVTTAALAAVLGTASFGLTKTAAALLIFVGVALVAKSPGHRGVADEHHSTNDTRHG